MVTVCQHETELDAERLSWSQNNSGGALASPLKLPMAGYRSGSNGSLGAVGPDGYYWSSTVNGVNSAIPYFNSSNADHGATEDRARRRLCSMHKELTL